MALNPPWHPRKVSDQSWTTVISHLPLLIWSNRTSMMNLSAGKWPKDLTQAIPPALLPSPSVSLPGILKTSQWHQLSRSTMSTACVRPQKSKILTKFWNMVMWARYCSELQMNRYSNLQKLSKLNHWLRAAAIWNQLLTKPIDPQGKVLLNSCLPRTNPGKLVKL